MALVFDDNFSDIVKLTIKLEKNIKVHSPEKKRKIDCVFIENIEIDILADTLTYSRVYEPELIKNRKCVISGNVKDVLEEIYYTIDENFNDDDDMYDHNPADSVPEDCGTFSIKIDYLLEDDEPLTRVIDGGFSSRDLPQDYFEVISEIKNFINSYYYDGLFDPPEIIQGRVNPDLYQFIQVQTYDGKKYYYLSNWRNDFKIGDKVIVPFGDIDTDRPAVICDIKYFSYRNAPFDPEKLKSIERKANECAYRVREYMNYMEILNEQECYDIFSQKIQELKLPFTIFDLCDHFYEFDYEAPDPYFEERKILFNACIPDLRELDRTKPYPKFYSGGQHYAVELFNTAKFKPHDDFVIISQCARMMSSVKLPLSEEQFKEKLFGCLDELHIPYAGANLQYVETPYSNRKKYMVHIGFRDRLLKILLVRLRKLNAFLEFKE